MYSYQKNGRFYAQHADGMEKIVAGELSELGASHIKKSFRGSYFRADKRCLYAVNYRSQLVSRVLAPIISFDCHSDRYLYNTARKIKWRDFMTVDMTFAVFATVANSRISHSQYAALKLKDALVDYFREETGRRPSVDTRNPDLWINLHIQGNKAVISIDCSGGSLHRRGYRGEGLEAPMQETLAAAIVRLTEWDGARPLHDPMCGSGTLLAEAMIRYAGMPASILRSSFGFERLPDFNKSIWNAEKKAAQKAMKTLPDGLISGSDISGRAVEVARGNLAKLPGGKNVKLDRFDFRDHPGLPDSVIITNPPYGIRLGKSNDVTGLYRAFGDFLKSRCGGSEAYVYFGDRDLMHHLGLGTTWKKDLKNGGLDGMLAKFKIY